MNKNFNDLTGQQFGEWTVLEYKGKCRWLCRCSCGVEKIKRSYDITHGYSKSCGHGTIAFKDLTGQQFGDLKAVEYLKDKNRWLCQCSCGEMREVRSYDLTRGLRRSCGHIRRYVKLT